MRDENLIRFGGLAAILGGTLRGLASFIPSTTPRIMALYFFTDVSLLFGSIGIHRYVREDIGLTGSLGLLVQMVSALILIARDVALPGSAFCQIGALAFAAGLDLFAVGSWGIGKFPRWILLLLVLSTIVGPIGYFAAGLSVLFVASGLLLGIGFAGVGITMSPRGRY